MKLFLRSASYIFHPLLIPFFGAVLYFNITPRFIDPMVKGATLSALLIITFLIPTVIFFLLRNLRLVSDLHLPKTKERKFPLMIYSLLLLVIIKFVFNPYSNTELYYFFLGVLFASLSALVLVLFNIKASLHQMAIAGITTFLIGLSIHFTINVLPIIALAIVFNGWVASSRLFLKAHTISELIIGGLIGFLSQSLLFAYWL
jgi:membrane-associated phospholipid phosphatase